MYGIPGVDPVTEQLNAPLNFSHGYLEYGVGTFTGSVPDNVFLIWVTLQGTGGGGTSGTNSGGAGGLFYKVPLKVTPGALWTVTVLAGVGSAAGANPCTFTCCGNSLNTGAAGGSGAVTGAVPVGTAFTGATIAGFTGIAGETAPTGGGLSPMSAGLGPIGAAGDGTIASNAGICIVEW